MYTMNLNYKKLIDDFLKFKRSCGYKYFSEEITLKSFYNYTKSHSNSQLGLSKDFLDQWVIPGARESRKSISNRVSTIKQFCVYLSQLGYKVYIPKSIKNSTNKSFIPYVFTHQQIDEIFKVIDAWPKAPTNRYNSTEVYPILFRLLYGCGLRISEALHLKIKNINLETGVINIDVAKYDKKRVVVMSDSLKQICIQYKAKYLIGKDQDSTFFQHKDGSMRNKHQVNIFFRQILYKANIAYLGRGKGPYLHNLRHTFACHSFYSMYKRGIDMQVALTLLSTYLGHSNIKATERYLKLTQEIFPDIICKINNISCDIYIEVEYEN